MVNIKFINILGQREITATNFHVVIRTINHKISNAWFWGYVGLDFTNFMCISVILGIYWLRFPKLHVYLSRSWKILSSYIFWWCFVFSGPRRIRLGIFLGGSEIIVMVVVAEGRRITYLKNKINTDLFCKFEQEFLLFAWMGYSFSTIFFARFCKKV